MTQWLLPVLGAFLGYLGHWGQQTLGRRHGRRDAQQQLMRQLREKLLEMQRQWRIFDTWGELKPLAEAVYLDSDLLLNEELRSRVRGDLYAILLVDHYAGPSNQIVLTRSESVVYLCQDASGCIAAHIRGSGVPPISREVSQCLWYYAQMRARIDFAVQARMDARDALIDLI